MSVVPSIKGSVFRGTIESLRAYARSETISQDRLEASLTPKDRDLLETPIVDCAWYPIEVYVRMNELMLHVVGKGDPEFLEDLGRQNACRLIESDTYMQLRYLGRTEFSALGDPDERRDAFGRDLVVIASLQASTLNFSTQVTRPDPNHPRRWICEVTGAEHYPAVYALRAKGFKNEMARRYGQPDLWAWERPESDRVVWRMVRDL